MSERDSLLFADPMRLFLFFKSLRPTTAIEGPRRGYGWRREPKTGQGHAGKEDGTESKLTLPSESEPEHFRIAVSAISCLLRNAKVMFSIQKGFSLSVCLAPSLPPSGSRSGGAEHWSVEAHSESSHASLKLSLPSVVRRPQRESVERRASDADVHGKKGKSWIASRRLCLPVRHIHISMSAR